MDSERKSSWQGNLNRSKQVVPDGLCKRLLPYPDVSLYNAVRPAALQISHPNSRRVAHMTQVACIIICPTGSAYTPSAATAGVSGSSSPSLLPVGGRPVLDHWLSALQDCSWLLPLQQKLFIACDVSQQAKFQSWATKSSQAVRSGFLGGKQILATQLGSSAAPDQVVALSAVAATGCLPDMLVVIDGASLCEPGFSMHRFIQHALVRNKDTVAFSSAPFCEQLNQQFQFDLQAGAANPQVKGIIERRYSLCSSDSISSSSYAAPIFAIKASSVPKLEQTGCLNLCAALQMLMNSEDVYGLPVQCSFDLSTLDGYLYAAAFYDFYQQHWKLLHGGEEVSETPASQVQTSPMHAVLSEFNHNYADIMTAEAYARYMQGRSGSLSMPERFTDASLWRWRRKYEHPVYMTSNNDYGAKPPSQQMLPPSWHGVKGEFTKNYIKAEIRTGNFSTGLPTSRVHDALTELC